jgi:hypothetical protein
MRLEFDAESGVLYVGVREGRVEQTLDPCGARARRFYGRRGRRQRLRRRVSLTKRVHRARNPLWRRS